MSNKLRSVVFDDYEILSTLAGEKSVFRRPVNPRMRHDESGFQVVSELHTGKFVRVEKVHESGSAIFPDGSGRIVTQPAYQGEVLFVRESWRVKNMIGKYEDGTRIAEIEFAADGETIKLEVSTPDIEKYQKGDRYSSPLHMPENAARLYLLVTDVRVDRLNEFAFGPRSQIAKEGFERTEDFAALWDLKFSKKKRELFGWNANPFVWVVEYEVISKEDALKREEWQ